MFNISETACKKTMAKKVFIVILILLGSAAAYVCYDWYKKTYDADPESSITFYSWYDRQGVQHFTDTIPPEGAKRVKKLKGYKYIAPPFVVSIKATTLRFYHRLKSTVSKIFTSKSKKKGKKR